LWAQREAKRALIGEVRAVEGDVLTLALIGKAIETPMDGSQLPPLDEKCPVVRVTTGALIKSWQRVGTARRQPWQRFSPIR
jgi:hypothetical protein